MAFTSTPIAGGTTGSLADSAPAIDRIASVDYQRIKWANPNADQTGAYGIDTDPMRVRPRRRGTADYDSGNSAIPASSTALTATLTYLERLVLTNISDASRTVTITNTAGDELLSQYPIGPRTTVVLPLGGIELLGIKWLASTVGTVRGQILGSQ